MTTSPTNGGTACPTSPETRSCTPSPSPTPAPSPVLSTPKVTVDWDYMVPPGATWFNVSEMPLVHCEIGQYVEISWGETSLKHNVYELYSYSRYIDCDFNAPSTYRAAVANSGNFTFMCDSMGTRFFSCSVGKACSKGKQRIRVHGIDSRKTKNISDSGGSTLAEYMKASVTAYKGGTTVIPESKASNLETMLLSIASNSPESCSDWLIPSHLSNTTCLGYVYTDLGVLFRQRASSDLDKAKSFYEKALNLIPDFCLAESYLVELYIKKNDQNSADTQFEVACQACGKSNLDMELVRMAYEEKGWVVPVNSDCRVSKSENNLIASDNRRSAERTGENETDELWSAGADIYNGSVGSLCVTYALAFVVNFAAFIMF